MLEQSCHCTDRENTNKYFCKGVIVVTERTLISTGAGCHSSDKENTDKYCCKGVIVVTERTLISTGAKVS